MCALNGDVFPVMSSTITQIEKIKNDLSGKMSKEFYDKFVQCLKTSTTKENKEQVDECLEYLKNDTDTLTAIAIAYVINGGIIFSDHTTIEEFEAELLRQSI